MGAFRPIRPAELFVFSLVSSSWTSEVERGEKETEVRVETPLLFNRDWISAEAV